ncbi:Anaphase-promoting complex subunit 8 [Histomonas meleagridis]|uniref:Anaphase-promoting complex subunit 8 n=1 Tax=Histomonas meleagridis TaxID=135588 RepID=UPI00355A47D8|nr:Anaphase-promoting complex subunit 8 [Histomonas meleagridis]KAH0799121.1 Anaphase-promoting complex subunit 8 [Histomonas meleagridis]
MESLKYLVQSLTEFPLNREAWILLRTILVQCDESVIAPTVSSLPDHWTTILFRIELYSELQQTEASLQLIQTLNIPRTPSVISIEATAYYHHRDFDYSQLLFDELIKKDPFHVETLDYYSNLLFVKGDISGLASLVQTLHKIDKFSPESLIATGNFLSINGQHQDAIKQFSMVLKFNPLFHSVWTLIGQEFIELGNCSGAIASYTKALELNPRDFRALYGMGRAYEMSNMLYLSIQYHRKSITINPFDSRIWMALGECYEKLNEKENAIRCYQRAVCNVDNEGEAIFKLAKMYKEVSDIDKAAFCYESFIENFVSNEEEVMKENNPKKDEAKEAITFLAQYYMSKRKVEKAQFYAEKLLFDEESVAEGNALMKDIKNVGK